MGSCIYYSVYIVHWGWGGGGGGGGGGGQLASIHSAGAGVRMSMHVLVVLFLGRRKLRISTHLPLSDSILIQLVACLYST